MKDNVKILVGKIVAPQGIHGEFRVQSFAQSPNDFQKFHIVCDKCDVSEFHFVRALKPNLIIAKIDGINDRNTVESLRGTGLFVLRDDLPELNSDEYYQADLIGFDVVRDGKKIGVVDGFQLFIVVIKGNLSVRERVHLRAFALNGHFVHRDAVGKQLMIKRHAALIFFI